MKFGLYLLAGLAFSTSASALTTKKSVYDVHINNNGNKKDFKINEIEGNKMIPKNFLQSASEEKLNTDLEKGYGCGRELYRCDKGYGYGASGANCGGDGYFGQGYDGNRRLGYGTGSCANQGNLGYGSGLGYRARGVARVAARGGEYYGGAKDIGYGARGGDCYRGANDIGYGARGGDYNGGASEGEYLGGFGQGYDGIYNQDLDCGYGPNYAGGYQQDSDQYRQNNDLRGKYMSLDDAAALLGCERERKLAASQANKNADNNTRANENSNYLNRDNNINKKYLQENDLKNNRTNTGKDCKRSKYASNNAAACDRDHQFNANHKQSKTNCRAGKNEALCMNENNLDKSCSDGNLFEEFDKLEHFKKCADCKKEKLNGKDCTVKKSDNVQKCENSHSLDSNKNAKKAGNQSRSLNDDKECFDYNDYDLQNQNSKYNKIDKECESKDAITKACKAASSRDNDSKGENSKDCSTENKDKVLKAVSDKSNKAECVDKSSCIDSARLGQGEKHTLINPAC